LASPADSQKVTPFIDVQVVDADGRGEQLDLRLVELPPKKAKAGPDSSKDDKSSQGSAHASSDPGDAVAPKEFMKYP